MKKPTQPTSQDYFKQNIYAETAAIVLLSFKIADVIINNKRRLINIHYVIIKLIIKKHKTVETLTGFMELLTRLLSVTHNKQTLMCLNMNFDKGLWKYTNMSLSKKEEKN